MDCPSCGHANLEESRLCAACRTPLLAEGQCSNCRTVNADDAQFCTGCGTVLSCPNCGRRDVGDGEFCQHCSHFLTGPGGIALAGLGQRVAATLLDIVLFFLTLIVGYVIWELGFTLRNGQTPGKQLVGIRVIRADGTPSDWGWTFLREWVVKWLLFSILLSELIVAWLVDYLWAFWDKDRQTLHDKIMKTYVVEARAPPPSASIVQASGVQGDPNETDHE